MNLTYRRMGWGYPWDWAPAHQQLAELRQFAEWVAEDIATLEQKIASRPIWCMKHGWTIDCHPCVRWEARAA